MQHLLCSYECSLLVWGFKGLKGISTQRGGPVACYELSLHSQELQKPVWSVKEGIKFMSFLSYNSVANAMKIIFADLLGRSAKELGNNISSLMGDIFTCLYCILLRMRATVVRFAHAKCSDKPQRLPGYLIG